MPRDGFGSALLSLPLIIGFIYVYDDSHVLQEESVIMAVLLLRSGHPGQDCGILCAAFMMSPFMEGIRCRRILI